MGLSYTITAEISESVMEITKLIERASQDGKTFLTADVGEHIDPGDVFDAYEALGLVPQVEDDASDVEGSGKCGPLTAIYLHKFPGVKPSMWRRYVLSTFDEFYIMGFMRGFKLQVRNVKILNIKYLTGIYDGIMAHAVVF